MSTVTDSFTYSDGALPTVSSGLWTAVLGTINVASNVIKGNTTGDNAVRRSDGSSYTDDQDSQIVATVKPVEGSDDGGPCVRCQSGSNSFYLADFSVVSGKWHVGYFRCDSGTFHALGSDFDSGITANNGDTLKLRIAGTTLTASINGTDQTTQTDATYASGVPGIHIFNNTNIRWDSWQSTAQVTSTDTPNRKRMAGTPFMGMAINGGPVRTW